MYNSVIHSNVAQDKADRCGQAEKRKLIRLQYRNERAVLGEGSFQLEHQYRDTVHFSTTIQLSLVNLLPQLPPYLLTNPLRNLPCLSKRPKLVEKMLLQELMHLVVVVKLRVAPLEMLDLVQTLHTFSTCNNLPNHAFTNFK